MAEAQRACGLDRHGITNIGQVYWDLSTPALYEQITSRREGVIAHLGPVAVKSGEHTGRSPADKFVVDDLSTHKEVWWGPVNHPMSSETFERLYQRQLAYLQDKDVFVQNCYSGSDPNTQLPIRIITQAAWHSLVARNLFVRELDPQKQLAHVPAFTIICTPEFHAVPEVDGTASEAFIVLNISRGLILIGGTSYAGEIKKSLFTLMHYLLPPKGVHVMHCSANYGKDQEDVALFFGLSGTGKTALATSPARTLIGDDEHGWDDKGVFNLEGGCYAKVIHVTKEAEPEIFATTRMFGTVLENVGIDLRTRHPNFDDSSLTENTRAAYPIGHIPRADRSGMAGHPKHIIFLTYDAFGIFAPVSRLTLEQANYYYLSGYTSKVAGTEMGVKEPQAVFSPCFASPFLPRPPRVFAELLKSRMGENKVDCWLVNTGLTGGPYGVGTRIPLAVSRAVVSSILDGSLAGKKTRHETVFGLDVPLECEGVAKAMLDARGTWSDPAAYDKKAKELLALFAANFKKFESSAAKAS